MSAAKADGFAGVVFNPGGFVRQLDAKDRFVNAIREAGVPVIEVHYTNPLATLGTSPIGPSCKGVVFGFGMSSYLLALQGLKAM